MPNLRQVAETIELRRFYLSKPLGLETFLAISVGSTQTWFTFTGCMESVKDWNLLSIPHDWTFSPYQAYMLHLMSMSSMSRGCQSEDI